MRGRARATKLQLALIGCCASLALIAPSAQAALTWDPEPYDFGSHTVGTKATQTFTLTATCDAAPIPDLTCFVPPGGFHFFAAPTVTGNGFALGDLNTCTGGVLSTPVFGSDAACQIDVTFAPTSPGPRPGAINFGTDPAVPLSGNGVKAPAPGAVPKKKCKKGKRKSAAAARKKCKKKKKK